MLTLSDIAARVQGALTPLAGDIVYRVTALLTVKTASAVTAGATSVTLTGLPAGMDRVKAGDTFNSGLQTFTAEVVAVNGTITAAPFAPALTGPLASGTSLQVVRNADTPCKGFVEFLDTGKPMQSPRVKQLGMSATILANSLPFAPKVGDTLISNGRVKKIENVGLDPAGTAWVVLAQG